MKKLPPCYDQNPQVHSPSPQIQSGLSCFKGEGDSPGKPKKCLVHCQCWHYHQIRKALLFIEQALENLGIGSNTHLLPLLLWLLGYCVITWTERVPKADSPVPSPVVASWIPLSGSTIDVPTQTQPGVPTVIFLILWIHPFFFTNMDHILEQFLVSAKDCTQKFTWQHSWPWCYLGVTHLYSSLW